MEELQKITIDEEFRKLVPKPLDGEYMQLEENILRNGCRDPLVLWQRILLDGHHRYEICQKHDLEYKTVNIDLESRGDAKIWMIHNQLGRRNLSRFQRIEMVIQLKAFYTTKGKENMSVGGSDKGLSKLTNLVNTRQVMATLAGVSEGTLSQAEEIIETVSEAEKQELREGKKSINRVFKLLEIKKKEEKSKASPKVISKGHKSEEEFNVILFDPSYKYKYPWSVSKTLHYGELVPNTMPAADDSIIFLWASSSELAEAIEMMQSWGFSYKSNLVWDKKVEGSIGSQHELLLIGTKGTFLIPDLINTKQSIYSEASGEHGEKPDYYYQLIEDLFPNGKCLEIYNPTQHNAKWTQYKSDDLKNELCASLVYDDSDF